MHAATATEWVAVLSLGTGITAAALVPWLLLIDSESARDFDPRPAVRRAIESGRFDAALVAVVNARHTANEAIDRIRTFSLTIPTGDHR